MKKREKKIQEINVKQGKKYLINANSLFTCCDCGLTHRYKFSLEKKNKEFILYLQSWRNEKMTKKNRLKSGILQV